METRGVGALVDRNVHRWELEEAIRNRIGGRHRTAPPVAVSREYGSQGAAVANLVAGRLDRSLWDKELLHAVAEQSGAEEALLAAVDERTRSALRDLIEASILGDEYTESEFLRHLRRVVRLVARLGAVIVGRGAQYLLDGDALRVRVVAPLEIRVARVVESQGLDEKHATSKVQRIDQERARFVAHHFGRDVAAPADYDLVVNTGTLTIDRAADVIVAAYRAKFGEML